jgi:hypothetical protein
MIRLRALNAGRPIIATATVTVSGGVAELAEAPSGIAVCIVDFDNLKDNLGRAMASQWPLTRRRALSRVTSSSVESSANTSTAQPPVFSRGLRLISKRKNKAKPCWTDETRTAIPAASSWLAAGNVRSRPAPVFRRVY